MHYLEKLRKKQSLLFEDFFYLLFGCPTANFGSLSRGILTNPMLITAFYLFRPEGHREHHNEVGSQNPAEHLVRFEPGFALFQTSYFRRTKKKYIGNEKTYVTRIQFVLSLPASYISGSYIKIKII